MNKKWLSAMLTVLCLITLTGSAFAWSGRADVEGKPDELNHKGYYIWQDNSGFHIWTTNVGRDRVYSGVIRTDGEIHRVRGNRLEQGDSFRFYNDEQSDRTWFRDSEGEKRRHFIFGRNELDTEQDRIRFKFDNDGGSDGLNFSVRGASYLEFDLYVDGKPVSRKQVYIGEEGWHPTSNHFKFVQ